MPMSKNTLVTVAIAAAATIAAEVTVTEVKTAYETHTLNPLNMRVRSQFHSSVDANCQEPSFKEVAAFVARNGAGTLTATK